MAVNKLIATIFAAIATFENDRRKERQRQGILAAKQAGKYTGRKIVIDKTFIRKVKYLNEKSGLSVTQISKLTEKSRATIDKILKDHLGYVSKQLIQQPLN